MARRSGVHEPVQNGGFSDEPQIVGLWYINAGNALFDDFGGGNTTTTTSSILTPVLSAERSGTAASVTVPLLSDPALLLFAPLAVLAAVGRRRRTGPPRLRRGHGQRAWWSYLFTGLLLMAALVGIGYLLTPGFNPPPVLAARPHASGLPQTPTNPQTTVIHYTYDPLYRLAQVSYSTGQNFNYTYDSVGNRLTETGSGGAKTYTYDDSDRLTAVNGVAYTWDNNGNLLSDGQRTFTYDTANRLKQVVSGTLTTQYAYLGDPTSLRFGAQAAARASLNPSMAYRPATRWMSPAHSHRCWKSNRVRTSRATCMAQGCWPCNTTARGRINIPTHWVPCGRL